MAFKIWKRNNLQKQSDILLTTDFWGKSDGRCARWPAASFLRSATNVWEQPHLLYVVQQSNHYIHHIGIFVLIMNALAHVWVIIVKGTTLLSVCQKKDGLNLSDWWEDKITNSRCAEKVKSVLICLVVKLQNGILICKLISKQNCHTGPSPLQMASQSISISIPRMIANKSLYWAVLFIRRPYMDESVLVGNGTKEIAATL